MLLLRTSTRPEEEEERRGLLIKNMVKATETRCFSENDAGEGEGSRVMAALSDLDTLLGDLEKTCQGQGGGGKGSLPQSAGSSSSGRPDDFPSVRPNSSDEPPPTIATRNELDEMLSELTAAR